MGTSSRSRPYQIITTTTHIVLESVLLQLQDQEYDLDGRPVRLSLLRAGAMSSHS